MTGIELASVCGYGLPIIFLIVLRDDGLFSAEDAFTVYSVS